MINLEISRLEKKMDLGTEVEKAYLNDYLENRSIPDKYRNFCKTWNKAYEQWNKLCHTNGNRRN